jgi:two-component system invasion response regulator UvrY
MRKGLIVNDHEVVRYGLRHLLADEPDEIVIGEATTGQEVLERVGEQPWDVVLLDMAMPGKSGLKLIKEWRSLGPHLPVLVLSMHSEDQDARRMLTAGAKGSLTTGRKGQEIVNAIRKVSSGQRDMSGLLAKKLVD